MKNGTSRQVQKKMFPGYVLLNMVMNDDTWYVVRNTRGVTGFVGPGSKPVPLTEEEMMPLGIQKPDIEVDFAEGDMVVVTGGAWKDTAGVITGINMQKQTVTINVELFGRETPVEISFTEIKKAETSVSVNSDDNRDDKISLISCSCVELLSKLYDVYTMLSKSRTYRWCWSCFTSGNL